MDVTLYPDEDWAVDAVHDPDVSAVTLTAPDGSEVRIEADFKVLRSLAERWLAEFDVTANGRNPDAVDPIEATLAALEDHADKAQAHLEELLILARSEDETRYPPTMTPGDWVRFPPSKAWRKIDAIHERPNGDYDIVYIFGGVTYPQTVRASTRYPYCTAARFAEVCDR